MAIRTIPSLRRGSSKSAVHHAARLRGERLERRILLSITPGLGVGGDQQPQTAYEAALADFHGLDLAGKDGPMARLGFDLTLLREEYQFQQVNYPGTPFAGSNSSLLVAGNVVTVETVATGDVNALKSQLARLGMTNMESIGSQVVGSIPIPSLSELATLNGLASVRTVHKPNTSGGLVTTQGDEALRADLARAGFNVDGTGLTVGILSDSFDLVPYAGGVDGVQRDIATGDLPAQTQILQDSPFGNDEGRGMAQLIHDIAPGAAIKFATAELGPINFANNIRALAAAGCDVIVDDVGYFNEPFFQDGVIAQAVDDVVASGVTYFSSAGNNANNSYQGTFVDSGQLGPIQGRLHDFDPGPGVVTKQPVFIPSGASFAFILQWDQPFGSLGGLSATSDVDFYLYGPDGTTIVDRSIDINNVAGGDPVEIMNSWVNTGPDATFYISIDLFSGAVPNLLKYVAYTNGILARITGFATDSSTLFGHANAAGAIGVAAAPYFRTPEFNGATPVLESFSSLGGTPILFDTAGNPLPSAINRESPQLTGVDNGNTTFFGRDIPQDADTFPNFSGTSASAPHLAAIAALMLQAAGGRGSLTPSEVLKAMQDSAIDVVSRLDNSGAQVPIPNGQGVDAFSGFGLVDGFEAVRRAREGVTVGDVAQFEGDSGTTNFIFTVTFAGNTVLPITVEYATEDGTAAAGVDYQSQSGTLTFNPGGTQTRAITIQVKGDVLVESDETFLVKLTNITNASLKRRQAVGKILNDDIELSINDVTVLEGDSGTNNAVFTLSGFGSVGKNVTVAYTTLNGTAVAASDYLPRGGAATLAPGGGTAKITVPIVGDKFNEGTETFSVMLSNTDTGRITDSIGLGTILDNDPLPSLYVNDVHVTTTEEGLRAAVFTVAMDAPSGRDVSMDFATIEGTAKPVDDYNAQLGTLTFAPGVTTKQVTVLIRTDTDYAPNKKFSLKLSNALNAQMNDPIGVCTIIFADAPTNEQIIDDGDPGYSQTAGWVNLTNTLAYQTDYDYHTPGAGGNFATWTFDDLGAGNYQVFARWSAFTNRATNAPYTILDGPTSLGRVLVNQQLAPTGDQSNGITWQSLGMFSISTGTLAVRLADNANGYVIADAVRIVADGIGPQVPEMDVAGFEQSIGTLDESPAIGDGTDFGTVATASNSLTHTFTVTNTGNADLHLTGSPRVQVGGDEACDFTVLTQPSAVIAPGFKSSFQIIFHPSQPGERRAKISIASDDDDEQPYTFDVRGFGGAVGPGQFTIDDAASGFQAFGNWATNANSSSFGGQIHSAAPGQGAEHSTWTFNDLAPGQYDVFTTWVPFGNRAANSPFTVADGEVSANTYHVDQRQAANDVFSDGVMWEMLTSLNVTSGMLRVGLSSAADGFVIADAVRIVRHGAPEEVAAVAPPAAPAAAHNVAMPLDVNGDGRISSIDALVVISDLLTRTTAGSSFSAVASPAVMTATASTTVSNRYVDVNGDGRVSPSDALAVISYLLSPIAPVGASASPVASPATVSMSTVPNDTALAAVDAAISQMNDTELAHVALPPAAADAAAPTVPASAEHPPGTAVLTPQSVRAPLASSPRKSPGNGSAVPAATTIDE
jgi:hypothetical protein